MKQKKQAVAVIAFLKGEVLLVERRDVPVWVLPGGGIDEGESAEQAALRELKEETGLTGTIHRKVAEYSPGKLFSHTTHLFECTILGGYPTTSNETKSVRFFRLDQLPYLLPPPYPHWIQDTLAGYHEVLHKPVEGISLAIVLQAACTHPILFLRFLLSRLGIHCNEK